jgi:hypothetical protein
MKAAASLRCFAALPLLLLQDVWCLLAAAVLFAHLACKILQVLRGKLLISLLEHQLNTIAAAHLDPKPAGQQSKAAGIRHAAFLHQHDEAALLGDSKISCCVQGSTCC